MLWVKAFHIIGVVCWFAGIFYLPRLFVYHAMSEDQISKDRFEIMERKLFWAIMTPSAVFAVVLGAWLLSQSQVLSRLQRTARATAGGDSNPDRGQTHPVTLHRWRNETTAAAANSCY